MRPPGRFGSLCFGLLLPILAHAQPAVVLTPEWPDPYVRPYSPCRASPPDDAAAQALYQSMKAMESFDPLRALLDKLQSLPATEVTAHQVEAYLLLLPEILFLLDIDGLEETAPQLTAVLDGRDRGRVLAERFIDNSFVRCAALYSELAIFNHDLSGERFSDRDRSAARDAFLAFMEEAARGQHATDTHPSAVLYAAGQLHLDKGFDALPNREKAASHFETGARFLLDAAANPADERHIDNWTRYAFMLEKLPLARRQDIAGRLLAYVEQSWGAKSQLTVPELRTYGQLLGLNGGIALARRNGEHAVSIYGRYVDIVGRLRRSEPRNPNHEVSESQGYLSFGDAHLLARDAGNAARAFRVASDSYASASADAREMLDFGEFSAAVAERLRTTGR
ncbi:MAG: hypothetical protein ACREVI_10400 [Steroidobacteraceae bacterium]